MAGDTGVFLPQSQLILFSNECDESLSGWLPRSLVYTETATDQYLKSDPYVAKALEVANIIKGRHPSHRPCYVTKVINYNPKSIPALVQSTKYQDIFKIDGEDDYEDISHIHASIIAIQAAYDSLNRHSDHLMGYLTAFSRFSGGLDYKEVDDSTAVFIQYKDQVSKLRFKAIKAFKSRFMLK